MVEFIRNTFDNNYKPDARFLHTAYLLQLQNAGYPFKGNDLSEEEWIWISQIKNARQKFVMEKHKQ